MRKHESNARMIEELQVVTRIVDDEIERQMMRRMVDSRPRRWADSRLNVLWRRSVEADSPGDTDEDEEAALESLARECISTSGWADAGPAQRARIVRATVANLMESEIAVIPIHHLMGIQGPHKPDG